MENFGKTISSSKYLFVLTTIILLMAVTVQSPDPATPNAPTNPTNNSSNSSNSTNSTNGTNSTNSTTNYSDLIIPNIYYSNLSSSQRDEYLVFY
jgi:hypothetical protein